MLNLDRATVYIQHGEHKTQMNGRTNLAAEAAMLLASSGESLRRKNWSHMFLEDRNGYAAPNLSKKAGTKSIMRFG